MGKASCLTLKGKEMLDYTGDKIANEIKELRKVLQAILDLLRADVCTEQNVSALPVEIVINRSVFDNEHLLRSQKPE